MAKLYLIPNLLSETPWQLVLPTANAEVICNLKYFIVEDIRNARRFLKKVSHETDIGSLVFVELNKHTSQEEINGCINILLNGNDAGIISEAGCPGIADPGAVIVTQAHQKGITVVPLVGPSSILLALMASGMNGQNFAFTGYLPVKQNDRIKRIMQLEKQAMALNQTQIFMETPYRNNTLLADLLRNCQPHTRLCIAADLTSDNEFIVTRTISDWRRDIPDLARRPAIFILGGNG